MDKLRVLSCISPGKDVDGLHAVNAGALMTGNRGFIPCTPKGILHLVKSTGIDIAGKRCAVIGRSSLVGKPAALLMLNSDATVTVCHSKKRRTWAASPKRRIIPPYPPRAGQGLSRRIW